MGLILNKQIFLGYLEGKRGSSEGSPQHSRVRQAENLGKGPPVAFNVLKGFLVVCDGAYL